MLHFKAAGGVAGGEIAQSSGAFFWVWTLVALGVSTVFSVVLSAQGLWTLRRHRNQESGQVVVPQGYSRRQRGH